MSDKNKQIERTFGVAPLEDPIETDRYLETVALAQHYQDRKLQAQVAAEQPFESRTSFEARTVREEGQPDHVMVVLTNGRTYDAKMKELITSVLRSSRRHRRTSAKTFKVYERDNQGNLHQVAH